MIAPSFRPAFSLERLRADTLDAKFASFLWDALAGLPPERIKYREAFDVADRLGLVWVWHGRVRVSQPGRVRVVSATIATASRRANDKTVAQTLTSF